jgi:uncharacterized protein YndB with AHSA1/START domain
VTVVTRSIHIEAPLARVFALVADPAARARLSPDTTPIRVEIEGGGSLQPGSVCHYRVQSGGRILDYRMRVVEFEPPRRMAAVSDTAVPFETRIELAPENGGTRLTHSERFEPSDEMLNQALPEGLPHSLLRAVYRLFLFEAAWSEALRLRERQEQALARTLGEKLERWLAAIKRHLEAD